MKSAAAAVIVACFALVMLFTSVLRHPQYTADGIVYARFAARDAGYSEREATLAARSFYERTPLMQSPRYRALVEIDPAVSFERSRVLASRVLYPWTAGILLPLLGFRSLFIVSAASYVAFGLALFWMLGAFKRILLAAIFCLIVLSLPLVRTIAASDLTDMLALLWWTLGLGALLRGLQDSRAIWPAALAIASVLLTLTRPTPYLILLPAITASVVGGTRMLLLAAFSSVVTFAADALATHAYGAGEQLRWIYTHSPGANTRIPAGTWYRTALASTARFTIVEAIRSIAPLLAIVAFALGLRDKQTRAPMLVLLTAALACLISIPLNPVPSSVTRVVFLPLIPVICAIFQYFARVPVTFRIFGAAARFRSGADMARSASD